MLKTYLLTIFIVFCIPILLHAQSSPQSAIPQKYLLDKGTSHTGFTFKFNTEKVENDDRLLLIVEDRKTNSFELNFDGGYFIKKNLAVGGLVKFGNSSRIGVDLSPQNVRTEVSKAERFWGVYGTSKFYIPLSQNNRFFLFNNFLVGGTFNNSLTESTTDAVLTRKFVQDRTAELRFIPGAMVNVIDGFSIEAGAEIAGIRSKWSDTSINGEPYTHKQSVSADLSINLLRLSLGFYYFF